MSSECILLELIKVKEHAKFLKIALLITNLIPLLLLNFFTPFAIGLWLLINVILFLLIAANYFPFEKIGEITISKSSICICIGFKKIEYSYENITLIKFMIDGVQGDGLDTKLPFIYSPIGTKNGFADIIICTVSGGEESYCTVLKSKHTINNLKYLKQSNEIIGKKILLLRKNIF